MSGQMTGETVLVEKGQRLVTRYAYDIPDSFVSCQLVWVEGRKRWQFWLPKTILQYTTIEGKSND